MSSLSLKNILADLKVSGAWRRRIEGKDWSSWLMGLLLILGVTAIYSNSLHGAFQYDDHHDIKSNITIRRIWPIWNVFYTEGSGFMTRPIANLTFALNFAINGFNPYWFHVTNLLIHTSASLALFGALRRTFGLLVKRGQFSGDISTLSLILSVLWAFHPLLTESVSYITQRYESLMGLFVILTFYCVARADDSPHPRWWWALACLSCLLALGSKEVAVSLPILVLLYDRAMLSGSLKQAFQVRRVLYMGFIVVWLGFAYIQFNAAERTFAGFEVMPWWRYMLNQPNVVLHYLRLAVWPHPLNFDYFWRIADKWWHLLPGFLVIGSLIIATIWGIARNSRIAFLGIAFFAVLAPTSSVMPINDLAVEHRMYLPLVFTLILIVMLVRVGVQKLVTKYDLSAERVRAGYTVVFALIISSLAVLTYMRNEDYRNTLDLWRDTIEKSPENPRAHNNYATYLMQAGQSDKAFQHFEISLRLAPRAALFHSNYGVALGQAGRYTEALDHLREAVKLEPQNSDYIVNLGAVHQMKGSPDHALACYEVAIQTNPKSEMAYGGIASVLASKHRMDEALKALNWALALNPFNPTIHFQKGSILLGQGDVPGAMAEFESASKLDAGSDKLLSDIGWTLHEAGLDEEAIPYIRKSYALNSINPKTRFRLAWILSTSTTASLRNGKEALVLASDLLATISPRPIEILGLMGVALAENGQFQEAEAIVQKALTEVSGKNEKLSKELKQQLGLFAQRKPYRSQKQIRYPA